MQNYVRSVVLRISFFSYFMKNNQKKNKVRKINSRLI